MSKPRYIIKGPQATGRRPVLMTLVTIWLFLDRFNIPQWGWGVYYSFAALLIIAFVLDHVTYKEQPVDIQKLLRRHYEETGQIKTKENE